MCINTTFYFSSYIIHFLVIYSGHVYVCVRVSQGNNVIIAMYVICICMSHVCIFVLYFALQIWRIIKYLSIYLSIYS